MGKIGCFNFNYLFVGHVVHWEVRWAIDFQWNFNGNKMPSNSRRGYTWKDWEPIQLGWPDTASYNSHSVIHTSLPYLATNSWNDINISTFDLDLHEIITRKIYFIKSNNFGLFSIFLLDFCNQHSFYKLFLKYHLKNNLRYWFICTQNALIKYIYSVYGIHWYFVTKVFD